MRLCFIPGFGETAHIFDQLAPLLPGQHVFIDNQTNLGISPNPTITLDAYARQLIAQYEISANDVVIGHSMGGWIAYAIKQLVGCPIVQIASWTDAKKVAATASNPQTLYWLIRRGIYFNRFTKRLLLRSRYRHRPSAPVFDGVFQHLADSPKEYVINQLRLILTPFEPSAALPPDVRIHAYQDSIVRYPDQPAVTVPGDHFSVYTHPQAVAAAIRPILPGGEDVV